MEPAAPEAAGLAAGAGAAAEAGAAAGAAAGAGAAATGAGAAARRSIGMSVFGGTLVSVILGTIMIPGFYVVMEKIKEYFKLNKENIKKEIVLKAKRLIKAEK